MEFIKTKNIMYKEKDGSSWYGIDYKMNLYKGCSHGCIYCDSRSNCYQIENFDVVKSKENAISILEAELAKKKKTGVIGIGSMSDTYNPQEAKYEITRQALKLILKYNFGVSIDTKSNLILRDIDLLKEINKVNNVIIKVTITTPNDELSKKIEPRVCVSSERFKIVKALSDNGIFAGIMMNPVLPFITDSEDDIKELVRKAYGSGAKFIHSYMFLTLRENQRDYYYNKLDELFPGLKEKYINEYKNKYVCYPEMAKEKYEIFKKECDKYGILYNMADIIKAYKKNLNLENEQISLF